MSNKQEATFHGSPSQETLCDEHKAQYFNSGYTAGMRDAQGYKMLCPGGTSARIDKDHSGDEVVLQHYDGSFCGHKAQPRMAITEDPAFGASVPWEPQARPEQAVSDLDIGEWVGQALGAASSCWSDLPNAGVFDSTRCAAINDALVAHIGGIMVSFVKEAEDRRKLSDQFLRKHYENVREMQAQYIASLEKEARLGLATTRSLLQELEVRFQVTNPHPAEEEVVNGWLVALPDKTLDYRTVDGA